MIFFVVGWSFINLCCTSTACCSLLTWAETKWVRQLIIHGTIISSIHMVIIGISRGISQLQIPPRKEKHPPKRDCSHPDNSLACSLRSCRTWSFFLEDCENFISLVGGIYPKQHISFKVYQVLLSSGIRRSISYLFWSTTPAKLCCPFRAILRDLIRRNLILGMFVRMALICSPK